MKIKIYGILLGLGCLLTGLFTGCSDDDDKVDINSGKIELSVDKKVISFVDAEASSQMLKITSNVHWDAASSKAWCKLSQTDGEGDAEVKVTVTTNSAMTSRTAEILVSAGSNYTDTVQVVQFGKEVESIIYVNDNERLTGDTMWLDCIVKKVGLTVLSNVDFTMVGENLSWAELVQLDVASAYDNVHYFSLHVQDNTGDARYGKITFQQKEGKYTKDIVFCQRKYVPELRFNEDCRLGSHFKVAELLVTSLGISNWDFEFINPETGNVETPDWLSDFKIIKCTEFENNVGQRYYLRGRCEQNTGNTERKWNINLFYNDKDGKRISQQGEITQLPWNGRASDSLVLLSLVEKNTVPAYGINLAWSLDAPVVEWERTKWADVGGTKRLARLGLGQVWLCYDLTADLANLDQLWDLEVPKNYLSGPVPEEFSLLENLEQLHIYDNYNDVLGFAPSAEPSGITEIPGVIFEKCTKLRQVVAATNSIKEIPAELSLATNLEIVDFAANDIVEVNATDWSRLTKLTSLSLSSLRKYKGPFFDFIFDIPSLVEISMIRVNFDGNTLPDKWDQLPNLETVQLGASNLTGPLPKSFGKCEKLTLLLLDAGDQFERMKNAFSGELPPEWGQLRNLVTLSVEGNNITGSIPESYAEMLSVWERNAVKFSMMNLSGNRMSGKIPDVIRNHDTWTGKITTRTVPVGEDKGKKVETSIGDLQPELYICPQQEGYGFDNCN